MGMVTSCNDSASSAKYLSDTGVVIVSGDKARWIASFHDAPITVRAFSVSACQRVWFTFVPGDLIAPDYQINTVGLKLHRVQRAADLHYMKRSRTRAPDLCTHRT